MILSEFSVKRPVAMIVIIIGLMALGLLALSKLRVNQIPDIEQPILVVNIPYPGANPETVEREVVNRIEKALQGISGVDRLQATAREGSATLVLFFDFDKDLVVAADEVRNAIASVRYKLPVEMREPILQRLDPAAQPIFQMALSSSVLTHAEISRLAEDDLADRFRGVAGVATVNVNGHGTVEVVEGSPDIGGSHASMAMMAAEVLGIDYNLVTPVVADTASVGFNFLTGGSRVTFATGMAKTVAWYLDHADWVQGVTSGAYREWVGRNYPDRAPR